MMQAHRGTDDLAHRSAQDTLARTKSKVWIHQGLTLAEESSTTAPFVNERNTNYKNRELEEYIVQY